MSDHLADVRRYDAAADEAIVNKIVKHLGIALRSSRDAALVAVSDPEELKRVRESWIGRKLGVTDDAKADAAIAHVAEVMKGDRSKDRVTFYYLTAKQLGLLDTI